MATVRIIRDREALQRILTGPSGAVARDILRRGLKVEALAKRLAPVDTGRLRASIGTNVGILTGGFPVARIGTNVKYAYFMHEGTGLYGPRHALITPKRGKVLVFKPRGARKKIFVRSVKGTPGTHYLVRALVAARD